jgi:uncharacterized PurR-regulated membrane protein YhhQ (DUF165 family)
LSEAAVYTISVFSEGVYVGAGVVVIGTTVVVNDMAVVIAGVEPAICRAVVVVGWIAGVVAGVIVGGCDVAQPARSTVIVRSAQTILARVNRLSRKGFFIQHHSSISNAERM